MLSESKLSKFACSQSHRLFTANCIRTLTYQLHFLKLHIQNFCLRYIYQHHKLCLAIIFTEKIAFCQVESTCRSPGRVVQHVSPKRVIHCFSQRRNGCACPGKRSQNADVSIICRKPIEFVHLLIACIPIIHPWRKKYRPIRASDCFLVHSLLLKQKVCPLWRIPSRIWPGGCHVRIPRN